MTAAGPWIRVDSGERPEPREWVLVCERWRDEWAIERLRHCVGSDQVEDGESFIACMAQYEFWARIIPPVEAKS